MDNWERICGVLSDIFEANRPLNFDIQLSPQQVGSYLQEKILFARLNSIEPSEISAALFVTIDGECGIIASKVTPSSYRELRKQFADFVVALPKELRHKLWCRLQKNNDRMLRLIERLGFERQQETETAYYYTYTGG